MIKAHKIKLNPQQEQRAYFYRAAGIARFAWNWALSEYKRRKAGGEKVDWNDIKKKFREKIDAEFPWVREVTKCAAEQAIADLRQAINTYYKAKQSNPNNKKLRFPGPRKRSKAIGGFGLNNDQFSIEGQEVKIPKLGKVNMAELLRFEGKIMSGRVKEKAGHWYLIVTVWVKDAVLQPNTNRAVSVGIDFGLSTFAVLSNGDRIETQNRIRRSERKLRHLQRGLSRKQKGSRNRAKWNQRIARQHERIANQRDDFLHKLTTAIARAYIIICVETLTIHGLMRTTQATSWTDAGIATAISMLMYKARALEGIVQKVDGWFPSSKMCSHCGYINHDLRLSDREWDCPQCNAHHDRDQNASFNIELEGLSLLAGNGSVGKTIVELATAALLVRGQGKSRL